MHHSSQDAVSEDRLVSRRKAVKGGLAAAAGGIVTLLAARSGGAAVTPLDVKRPGFTTFRAPSAPAAEGESTEE